MTRVFCKTNTGIEQTKHAGACCFSSNLLSSPDVVQNDQRSAMNVMVIARMPEDRSKTVSNS
eukprot:16195229-Heterocapsa_arctica.AAC.1